MIRVGLVGIGFMGRIHYLGYQGVSRAQVVAICSRDSAKLAGDWSQTAGNFGPPPGRVELQGVRPYRDFSELLKDPEIDLVDLCSPNHLHAEQAIQALEAGKHVLVEKAIALTLADADRMIAAAKHADRQLMVAHVLPFFPEFAWAGQAVQSGRFGALLAGQLKRVIAMPTWSEDFANAQRSGGPAVDLHIHDTHWLGLLAGVPEAVTSIGLVQSGSVNYVSTHYLYPAGGPILSAISGAVATAGRPFVHGFELYLERATIVHDSAGIPLTVFHADGSTEIVALPDGGDPIAAFRQELQAAVAAVETGQPASWLSAQLARDALALCLCEVESVKLGVPVRLR